MRFAHFFVDRPIFATVLSIVIVAGRRRSPISACRSRSIRRSRRRPSWCAPPIRAPTPRRSPRPSRRRSSSRSTASRTCSTCPRYSTSDGTMSLTITFKLGTDLDKAQVLVQNRVAIATPRLPEEVRRLGVTTLQDLARPDDGRAHALAGRQLRPALRLELRPQQRARRAAARSTASATCSIFGERAIQPARLARSRQARRLRPDLRRRRRRRSGSRTSRSRAARSARSRRRPTTPSSCTVTTQGRFEDAAQFRQHHRARDRRRPARAACRTSPASSSARRTTSPTPISTASRRWRSPSSSGPSTNALAAADRSSRTMERAEAEFPAGHRLPHRLQPDRVHRASRSTRSTRRCSRRWSLVVLVVLVFLQTWRTALIPILAIPVSLIGTFAVMAAFGFSLNTLTLFGLVLAIGIVVDDAIVVVENVERNIADGHDAARGGARDHGRGRRRGHRHRAGARRRCSSRPPSSPASPASSTGSSRSPSRSRPSSPPSTR